MASTNQINKIVEFTAVLGDLIILNFFLFILSYFWEKVLNEPVFSYTTPLMLVSLSVCYLACSVSHRAAFSSRELRADQVVLRVLKHTIKFSFLWVCAMTFAGFTFLSPLFFFVYFCFLFIALSLYRIIIRHSLIKYCQQGKHKRYSVFVGSGDNMQMLYEEMTHNQASIYHVCGYFDSEPNPNFPSACPYLGTADELANFLHEREDVKHIFCSLAMNQNRYTVPIANYCENHLLHFHSVPNVCKALPHRICLSMVGNMPILNLRHEPLGMIENRIVKRIFDTLVSGLFLITIFPFIYLFVGIVIKITSPGPIFFKQKRTGLNGNEFWCYKFRSMKVNKEADTIQATLHDPRKTKFGDFLRRSNLDELPQFINVFKGDMSVVGPRPHMLKHTEIYGELIDKYMVRHFIKPGVTGWAQTHGFRGETKELSQMEGRILADIWYMEHWTFLLDLYIMYKTVTNVLLGEKNAY